MKKTRLILLLSVLIFAMSAICFAKTHKEELLPTDSLEYTLEDEDKLSLDLFIDEDLQGLYEFQIVDMSSTSGRTPKLSIEVLRGKNVIYTYETNQPFDENGTFIGDKFCFYLGLAEGEYKINIENKTPTGDITFKIDTHFEEADYIKITPNDSFETATKMETGEKYIGGNSMSDEVDYFYFDVEHEWNAEATIYMHSTHKKWFYLYDEKGNEIGNIPIKIEDADRVYEMRTGVTKGRYYIGIVSDEDYDHDTYSVEVRVGLGDFGMAFEDEYNNEKEYATKIGFKDTNYGYLFGVEDIDFYTFDVKNDSEIELRFKDFITSKDAHYKLSLTDGENVIYKNDEQKTDTFTITLKKGTYYILVSSRGEEYFRNMGYLVALTIKKDLTEVIPSFADVTEDKWYHDDIIEAARKGLVNGIGDGKYNPSGNVTVAEAITMASRAHLFKNHKNDKYLNDGDKWYSGYVDYAKEISMIDESFSDFERPATRAEIAHFFAVVLEKAGDDYMADMEALKKYYVLQGDPDGQMHPERNLTRAEAAVILLRVYELITPIDLL